MPTLEQPFFDPVMAEMQRRLMLETEQGVADLELRGNRLTEDFNLMLGTPEAPGRVRRQLENQTRRTAGDLANRGFAGQQGVSNTVMGRLATEQTDALGEFHRRFAREQEDIQRQIAQTEQRGIIGSGEATRHGAGRASDRAVSLIPF